MRDTGSSPTVPPAHRARAHGAARHRACAEVQRPARLGLPSASVNTPPKAAVRCVSQSGRDARLTRSHEMTPVARLCDVSSCDLIALTLGMRKRCNTTGSIIAAQLLLPNAVPHYPTRARTPPGIARRRHAGQRQLTERVRHASGLRAPACRRDQRLLCPLRQNNTKMQAILSPWSRCAPA